MKKRIKKHIGKVTLVVLLNIAIIYIIASTVTYFMTQSPSIELIPSTEIENSYINTPTAFYYESDNADSTTNALNLVQIRRDLMDAESYLYKSQNAQKPFNLEKYFTDSSYRYLSRGLQKVGKIYLTERANLSHQIHLHFLSKDHKVAVLTDSAHVTLHRLRHRHETIRTEIENSIIRYVLIMEEGNWKIHKRKILSTRTEGLDELARGPQLSPSQQSLSSMRGINYYPQSTPWKDFWTQYSPTTTSADLETIRELQLDVVRIFIPYFDTRDVSLRRQIIDNATDFLAQAHQKNIRVIVTLFDFYEGVESYRWSNQMNYIDTLTEYLASQPALWMWDLKNEPDLDFDLYSEEQVTDWCTYFSYYLKSQDPTHLVTIGWSAAPEPDFPERHLDVLSFHHYRSVRQLPGIISQLQNRSTLPIIITETGRSSYHGLWSPLGYDQQAQARYYRNLNTLQEQHDIPYLAWTLHDFDSIPAGVVPDRPWIIRAQQHFGLYNSDGQAKLATQVLSQNQRYEHIRYEYFILRNPFVRVTMILIALALILYTFFQFKNFQK